MNELIIKPGQYVDEFCALAEHLATHMDVSAETIGDYFSRLGPFVVMLTQNGLHENTLYEYKKQLAADKTIKVSTKNKKLTVARIFLRELYKRGYLPRDITIGVKGFQQSTKHKLSGLNDSDMQLLREWVSLNQYRGPKQLRLTALLLLLTYQGLRQIEVCRLEYEDINFAENTISILGKGRDDKEYIHLNPDVSEVLKRYCVEFKISSGHVFFSMSNNESKGNPLTTRGLRSLITSLFNKLGIDKNVHGLRHYYVTKLVEEFPGELFTVMNFSRHKSLDQLQVYYDKLNAARSYPRHDMAFSRVLV